jgi:hypothetical protein
MKLLRLKPGHGEVVLAEGDVEVPEQERELIEAFRRELDAGMWAAVPIEHRDGRREAEMVRNFEDVPRDAERVIFFPRAAGGADVGEQRGEPRWGAESDSSDPADRPRMDPADRRRARALRISSGARIETAQSPRAAGESLR